MDYTSTGVESSLLRYMRVLRRRWLWIFACVCIAVLYAFISSKLSPKYYQSTAVILPSMQDVRGGIGISFGVGEEGGGKGGKEEGGGGGGGGNLGNLLGGQAFTTTNVLKAILHSRTLADALIEQFNLKAYYGTESMAVARAVLAGETTIAVNREKAFLITVETTNSQMAADMANAYVSNLDRLYRTLNVTSVTRNRMFIERRLEEKRKELEKAEEARKQFQIANRTLLFNDKASAAMKTAGAIEENILELEIDAAVLKEYATTAHPQMNQLEAQLEALNRQLDKLQQSQEKQGGRSTRAEGSQKTASKAFYPPMTDIPAFAIEYIRLAREVKIHEVVLSMLTGQLEQARIAEARDTPNVQILDPAIPAETKSRPRTLQNMQIAGAVGLAAGLLLVLLLDYVAQLRLEEARRMTGRGVLAVDSFAATVTADSHLVPGGNGGNGSGSKAGHIERQPETRHSDQL